MSKVFSKGKCGAFILGALCTLGALLFTGALQQNQVKYADDEMGRYRLQIIDDPNYYTVFVIDTKTGMVKTAHHKLKGTLQQADNMRKRFQSY